MTDSDFQLILSGAIHPSDIGDADLAAAYRHLTTSAYTERDRGRKSKIGRLRWLVTRQLIERFPRIVKQNTDLAFLVHEYRKRIAALEAALNGNLHGPGESTS